MDISRIFPYVVPSGYVQQALPGSGEFFISLGHDVFAMLVYDQGEVCGSVQREELIAANLSSVQAHERALRNLADLAQTETIEKQVHEGPAGTPFILWSGHWLAASCIRLPDLYAWASDALNAEEVCASIPQRESLLLFPQGERGFRDQMRDMIYETEQDARKLITWELFSLLPAGVQAFQEE